METTLGCFELSLNAPDLDAMRRFYAALGFNEVGGDPTAGWLMLANGPLRLGLYQGHVAANQLSFFTPDISGLAARLRDCGIYSGEVLEEQDGTRSITLADPAGNTVYFNTER